MEIIFGKEDNEVIPADLESYGQPSGYPLSFVDSVTVNYPHAYLSTDWDKFNNRAKLALPAGAHIEYTDQNKEQSVRNLADNFVIVLPHKN